MTTKRPVTHPALHATFNDGEHRASWTDDLPMDGNAETTPPEPLCAPLSDEQPESAPEDGGGAAGVVEAAARVLWETSRRDEGSISYAGANTAAQALAAAGLLASEDNDVLYLGSKLAEAREERDRARQRAADLETSLDEAVKAKGAQLAEYGDREGVRKALRGES